MVERNSDLKLLLELPTVGGAAGKPVDPAILRRQVDSAFRQAGYEWGAAREVARDLLNLVDRGLFLFDRRRRAGATREPPAPDFRPV